MALTAEGIDVADSDSITVLHDSVAVKVRLYGIDAPERRQPYYRAAKRYASELAFGKTVRVEPRSRDRWRRIVAVVTLPGGRVLNHEIVHAGYAWHFVKYASDDTALERLEAGARKAGRGPWNTEGPVPPWEWRRVSAPVH